MIEAITGIAILLTIALTAVLISDIRLNRRLNEMQEAENGALKKLLRTPVNAHGS